jgi:hypothetical protein
MAARRMGGNEVNEERLVRVAGWVSAGAGLAMLAAPRQVARVFGTPDTRVAALLRNKPLLLRVAGARDLANGLALLSLGPSSPQVVIRALADAGDLAIMVAELIAGRFRDRRSSAALLAVIAPGSFSLFAAIRWLTQPGASAR